MKTISLALLLLCAWAAPAALQAAEVFAPPGESPLVEATQNGVSFVSGGVGDGEQREMVRVAKDYNVHVTLTDPAGEYLDDLEVALSTLSDDKSVTLVETTTRGPLLWIRVDPGRYLLRVHGPGRIPETRQIDVPQTPEPDAGRPVHVNLYVAMSPTITPAQSPVDTATVQKVDADERTLDVATHQGPRHYRVTPETEILVGPERVPLEDLKPGRRVAISGVREGADFVATRILAVASGPEPPAVSAPKPPAGKAPAAGPPAGAK